jgi:hypothetical protein
LFDAVGAGRSLGGLGVYMVGLVAGLMVLVSVLDLAATTGRPLMQEIWSADMVVMSLMDCCVRIG